MRRKKSWDFRDFNHYVKYSVLVWIIVYESPSYTV